MRDHGRVSCKVWASEDFQALSEDGRLLWLYELTSPYSNMAGVYRLTNGILLDDLGWGIERVSKGLGELDQCGFSTRCPRTFWLIIHKYLEWNPIKGPKQHEGLVKVVKTLPRGAAISEACWKAIELYVQDLEPERLLAIRTHLEPKSDHHTLPLALGIPNPIGRVPIPVAVSGAVAGSGIKAGDGPSGASPPPAEAERQNAGQALAAAAFNAYADAFAKRHKTRPDQNAKVRGIFRDLVKRVGDAASIVAAHFVTMDRKTYIDAMHAPGLLIRDCEQIHADWRSKKFPDLNLTEWWTSEKGIRLKGRELKVESVDGDTMTQFTARVFLAAGEGKHLEKVPAPVQGWMNAFRQEAA